MITLKLKQKEAQAILSGAETFFSELEKIDRLGKKGNMAVFWRILFKDFKKGIKKAGEQYDKQIDEERDND